MTLQTCGYASEQFSGYSVEVGLTSGESAPPPSNTDLGFPCEVPPLWQPPCGAHACQAAHGHPWQLEPTHGC